ncbi:MAG: pyruvate kinase [Lachnospiraceae bacterium]
MKKTKIVCTMGPNTSDRNLLRDMILAGMDVARFNFSHGDHEEHEKRIETLKELRDELDLPIAMLLDTKGPEIRTGLLKDGKKVNLETGNEFSLYLTEQEGDEHGTSITYQELSKDVKPGDTILIDDGLIGLTVKEITADAIVCQVANGGELGQRKGVNVPNVSVGLPDVTDKDKEDILFGIAQGFDFIAASFVRSAECIRTIRSLLKENGGKHMQIIAKIENAEGVENIDAILRGGRCIMVARGDLGVEILTTRFPTFRNDHCQCNEHLKPVITATQMLDSMIRNPRPTRAEAGDVANAIYDGTDAIMLSGETAMGKYPLESVKMMAKIAETTEEHLDYDTHFMKAKNKVSSGISEAVGYAAVSTAIALNADCIITPTFYGQTARLIAHFRPKMPIYGVSPHDRAMRRMQLYWGVYPYKGMMEESSTKIMRNSLKVLKEKGKVKKDDLVVFTAGDAATNDVDGKSMTNMMNVVVVK